MKLQFDTNKKTITIEEEVNLGDLIELLTVMFPKFAWKDYSIVPVKEIEYFTNPVTVPWTIPYTPWPTIVPYTNPTPLTPTWGTITCGNANTLANDDLGGCVGTSITAPATGGAMSFTAGPSSIHNLIINKP